MKKLVKVFAASVLVLAGAVPALAAHSSKMNPAHHARAERVQTHRATDAMAYTPADASTPAGTDFGIGSQR